MVRVLIVDSECVLSLLRTVILKRDKGKFPIAKLGYQSMVTTLQVGGVDGCCENAENDDRGFGRGRCRSHSHHHLDPHYHLSHHSTTPSLATRYHLWCCRCDVRMTAGGKWGRREEQQIIIKDREREEIATRGERRRRGWRSVMLTKPERGTENKVQNRRTNERCGERERRERESVRTTKKR